MTKNSKKTDKISPPTAIVHQLVFFSSTNSGENQEQQYITSPKKHTHSQEKRKNRRKTNIKRSFRVIFSWAKYKSGNDHLSSFLFQNSYNIWVSVSFIGKKKQGEGKVSDDPPPPTSWTSLPPDWIFITIACYWGGGGGNTIQSVIATSITRQSEAAYLLLANLVVSPGRPLPKKKKINSSSTLIHRSFRLSWCNNLLAPQRLKPAVSWV